MRSVESRLAKLEVVMTPERPIIAYQEDRWGGTGLFRRMDPEGNDAWLTRDQVAQDAQGATAILVIYQPETQRQSIDVDMPAFYLPDNRRGDSD